MAGRAADAPAAWWPAQPDVTGGRDRLAGGTWFGVNKAGVVAAVLNRSGTLGPRPGRRSRGELPLIALAAGTAAAAAARITALDASRYRAFNMVVADRDAALFIRGLEAGAPEARAVAAGAHMVTAHDMDDLASPRIERYLCQFKRLPHPVPEDWGAWRAIMADAAPPDLTAINLPPRQGFGTVSASAAFTAGAATRWWFADGRPDRAEFLPVEA
jgi:hypothetical protein